MSNLKAFIKVKAQKWFKHIRNYVALEVQAEPLLSFHGLELQSDEDVLGVYKNPNMADFVVSTHGLHIWLSNAGEWEFLDYCNMVLTSPLGEEGKHEVSSLIITLPNRSTTLTVDGGSGKIRDLWSVYSFLIAACRLSRKYRCPEKSTSEAILP